jgi:hypothetical protein
MMQMLAKPLAVVAHDAGAANHIFAWLGDMRPTLCLAGPAQVLWEAHIQKMARDSASGPGLSPEWNFAQFPLPESALTSVVAGAATVITGTGWESNLEHDARRLARERGIHSIAVIDHWINYVDRFVRNGETVLPDEIWVSDSYAADIARSNFPSVSVVQQDNVYLEGLVTEVEARQLPAAKHGNDRVLYVLEPIRHIWGELSEPGEFLALDYFMAQRHRAQISVDAEIWLRPHPSDPPGKYDAWLSGRGDPRIRLDRSAILADAIAWSNVVVGCQTYAMVLALACGRRVVSTIPAWAPPCALPHQAIEKIAQLDPSGTFAFD